MTRQASHTWPLAGYMPTIDVHRMGADKPGRLINRMNRRVLLRSIAGVGATLALSACTAPAPSAPTQSVAKPTAAAAQAAPAQATQAPTGETPKKGGTLVVGLEAEP